MRFNNFKTNVKNAMRAAAVLLLGAGMIVAHAQVNVTAGATTLTLPDGSIVPMWGYTCTAATAPLTCAKLNPAATGWSPVVITVPTGSALAINLTNSLPAGVPTSLVIVGEVGGGLGSVTSSCNATSISSTGSTCTLSPDHSNAQANLTWPIANPGAGNLTPQPQGPRVQSFASEVLPGATATGLTWTATNLLPGTYLIESGTHPSIQGPMGLYGVLVVTTAPSGATAGTAYPGVSYNADVPLLFSEIDPVQNKTVNAAVGTAGFSETAVWSGQSGGCGNPNSSTYLTCYPPAVNYTPLYYLINGVAFNKTSASTSLFPAAPATGVAATGTVLVRMVNAGLRMHVPSIVGSQIGTAVAPAIPPSGFSLIAEDGNPLPGVARVQSEVFMAAGKTYDVMINVPTGGTALPIYDRELSLSGNGIARDAGMLAYISVNGAGLPSLPASAAVANPDAYNSLTPCAATPCPAFTVSDPAKGVIANDVNVYGVKVLTATTHGTLILNPDGTFTYIPSATGTTPDSFVYQANGTGPTATVTLGAAPLEAGSGITVNNISYTSNLATYLKIAPSGVLSVDKDAAGYPLTVDKTTVTPASGLTVNVDPNGGFVASVASSGTYTFTYKAKNSQGTQSASAATVTLIFPAASGLTVKVLDGTNKTTEITDYRWIIEEDRTFYVDPTKTTNTGGSTATTVVPTFGTNFHTSYMPIVATGCVGPTGAVACETGQTVFDPTTGAHVAAVCDVGNGVCRTDAAQETPIDPSQVHLDPTKRYYISVLPGDAADPFNSGNANPGHGMGGAQIGIDPVTKVQQTAVTIYTQPTPFPPSKLSVFVFEDDFPLNGEQDAGGGIDVLATNEPGLGGFNITLFDDAGGTGDATGQMTYDMFNQPLVNSLAGTIDPATGADSCPISVNSRIGTNADGSYDVTQTGITGTIVTCPKYEVDGKTLSPLAGQAVVANLMPGRYGVVATPGADRIGRGEEWLQTNTLDGQKAHDSFLRIGEPSFFQEFGPAGYHVTIGFANPMIINGRKTGVCNGTDPNIPAPNNCNNIVKGVITDERMSRTPDERLYGSGDNSSFAFTQCYVSLGDTDGEDFAFTKCDANGNFTLSGIPDGSWRLTVFDQWNDMLVDGLSTPVFISSGNGNGNGNGNGTTVDMGQIAMNQWQANLYTNTFFDKNGNGTQDLGEDGLSLVATNIRFRDGSYSNFNNTDLTGNAGFNEIFPLFSWYVVEADSTRYKTTGIHVVYDAGGPADGTTGGGSSGIGANMANTVETVPVPTALRVPGAYYCGNADCTDAATPFAPGGNGGTTGRIDPPWVTSEGWQGFSGQNSFLEFGKKPFAPTETGGIHGEVIYASTRPFDDPALLIHTSWTPDVPGVTINLYKEGTAPDGSTSLTMVDTTTTSSWDDWAQGFRSDGIPNMNCPGQGRDTGTNGDLFFFTLFNQPMYLDEYNHAGTPVNTVPNNSQFKCFDGMHNWNQLQPAPYDGMYQFPSVTGINPTTGKPAGTHCTICVPNPDATDNYRSGTPMLPAGKYVVEMIVPPGYELVKEEDKNILIGDNYIAPVTQEFGGLGNIFILPDQAEIGAAYNANNPQIPTVDLGRPTLPQGEGDTGSVEQFWPCVGAARVVPDFISLFPQSGENAPFAGATRNLCDRKEVTLQAQETALAKFWVFTSTHVAAHFTGVITDDFTSEFDPFSPQYGEKFSPPNLPVSLKDWTGTEISRVYTDQWGTYNGLTYSTWEVNPPNPTGYAPTMMVTCMNDPGIGTSPDPLFNPQYSQFCYEIPFMPGQTQYMDTPVVPTSGFAGAGYNNPDCAYPDATPAISEVDGDGIGPWVSAPGNTLTIKALGDQNVPNNGYSGPSATTAPFNQKTAPRHYGFGATQGTGTVTIGGVAATVTGWSDTQITVAVPSTVPACALQQEAQYGGSNALCGELVVTSSNGKQSIDTVTVTVGGKAPTHVVSGGTIQSAIDAAAPGDMIIVDPGVYSELLLMWKPVRLQGAGAASSIINANTHPAGKLDVWRAKVNCLFGLALNGQPNSNGGDVPKPLGGGFEPINAYDLTGASSCPATGWAYFGGGDNNPQVDRLPLEAVVGWDTTLNGNLAQLLQEPSLMGAYEGAGITVLAKGVRYPQGVEVFGTGPDTTAGNNIAHEGQMPPGTVLLTNSPADCNTLGTGAQTGYSSNFQCNPSRIDGLSITDSSQGGGAIFAHAWAHNLEISNNRIYNNTGTLTGGISLGQGESPDALLTGNGGDPVGLDQEPWTCVPGALSNGIQNVSPPGFLANDELPFCYNVFVNIHHNAVTQNSSIGDEVFSGTPAGAGGVTFCTGSDYYKFDYNWVCGNLSTGDGGGIAHLGFSYKGDIEHNSVLFNQSTNPTIPTNGGGIVIMGGAPDGAIPGSAAGTECGSITDVDCAPGLSDGTGPGLVINANLIMGNGAESGSGGGLRFQDVDGSELSLFPNGDQSVTRPDVLPGFAGSATASTTYPTPWHWITVTNNIISNNVAGWDGAGVSFQDALAVDFINNTVASNDSTASSGVLFDTLGAPVASAPGSNCTQSGSGGTTKSCPQPAGLVTTRNTAALTASVGALTCPTGHGTSGNNATCRNFSVPLLDNDVFWQNRSFYIGVGSLGGGTLNQQNVVTLYNAFTNTSAASQPTADATAANGAGTIVSGGTGACVTPNTAPNYWEIGVRGDTGPGNHSAGLTLAPTYSVLTDASDYGPLNGNNGTHNTANNPTVLSQYCNGSRTPPEFMSLGYQVPPGISDATVPNPIFNLTPAATVDEGNNWINISWGPLALTNAVTGTTLGNYGPASTSSVINLIPSTAGTNYALAPSIDFYGNLRKSDNAVDAGAVEFVAGTGIALVTVAPNPLAFGNQTTGTTSAAETLTLSNNGGASFTGITVIVTAPFSRPTGAAGGTCGATLAAASTCTINVVFSPTTAGAATGTATITGSVIVNNSPVTLTGTGVTLQAIASVTPASLAFGNVATGTTSAAQTLTLSNTGNATLTGITVAVTAPFSRPTGAAAGTCGTTLAAASTCTINVVFSPTAAGAANGTATVTGNVPVTNSPVALTGTGVAAIASVSPNSLAFGTVTTGTTSPPQTLTLSNTGNATLSGITLNFSSPRYSRASGTAAGTCGATLAAGATCTIGVVFSPVNGNVVNATLSITGSVTVTGSPVTLSGN